MTKYKFKTGDKIIVINHSRGCYAPVGIKGIINSHYNIANSKHENQYDVAFSGDIVEPTTNVRRHYGNYTQQLNESDLRLFNPFKLKQNEIFKCMTCFKEFKGKEIVNNECPKCGKKYNILEVYNV